MTLVAITPKYVPSREYNARHDAAFQNVVIGCLLQHVGESVNLERLLNADHEAVRDAVDGARRLGLCITARQGKPGYTLHPVFQRPRWLRLEMVHRQTAEGQLRMEVEE